MGLRLRGRLKSFLHHLPDLMRDAHDAFCERQLGINTRGRLAYDNDVFSDNWELGHYEHAPYYALSGILKRLALTEKDVFADYGCGKGRAVCCASRLRLKKVLGIEITPELARAAEENVRAAHGKKSPVEIATADATEFDCREVTAFYFFNPFGKKTVAAVLQKILTSLRENPRPIQIAYYNPTFGELLENCGWLKKDPSRTYHTWTKSEAKLPYIEFYRNTEFVRA